MTNSWLVCNITNYDGESALDIAIKNGLINTQTDIVFVKSMPSDSPVKMNPVFMSHKQKGGNYIG